MTTNVTAVSYALELSPADTARLRAVYEESGAAIVAESTTGDDRYQVSVTELAIGSGQADPDLSDPDQAAGLQALREALSEPGLSGIDTALVPSELRSAGRKLLIMDVDSTLIQQEVIELLAAYAGKFDEVAAVTEAAMRGELDFTQSLHARVAVLAGLPVDVVDAVRAEVRLSLGAAELVKAFKAAGHVVAVVSGGFNQILQPIAEDLGLDYWQANELEIVDGVLTGKVLGDVVDRAAKEKYLRQWTAAEHIDLAHTIAVGDGANDLDMLGAAGIGVAFNAKPAVRAVTPAAINFPYLDAVRHIAGV
ncbi:phosphoserine phosphatase SerB [Pseudarthrobacter sp. J75]|uniref:phosphoserine phosphatase SerB n=1 Tax=unclassified Pseudarthrobacter TaxID=2647000 RepID=UPI002E81EDDC|nr:MULTISPECIES: phosphoserine phosphatase SerB [unclassified Pseudarthrobacter]MEE2523074.1 phosphoserine phosphatase SerB [Pseudarthrobacter sp. J47]MEE2529757.1 phosphoserine phosphatase SerB [Pseudarthrobacter sp. J75]